LNGILLYCESVEGSEFGGHVESTEGPWGDWVGMTQCDHLHGLHHFLTAFSLQVETYQVKQVHILVMLGQMRLCPISQGNKLLPILYL